MCPAYAGGDGKTASAADCSADIVTAWTKSHVTFKGIESNDADPRLLDAVARASIDLNANVNVSSMQRLPGNPSYKQGSLHSQDPGRAIDVDVINGRSIRGMSGGDKAGIATAFQRAMEGYIGGGLAESLGPRRFWNRDLGGLFKPSDYIYNLHQTHVHIGVTP